LTEGVISFSLLALAKQEIGSFYKISMDFNQVRYFLTLADTLNFTQAAEKCFVTQPALTQAIKRLEKELGAELVHRDGKNTELTKFGESLRGYFEQIERAKRLVHSSAKAITTSQRPELNIGLTNTVGPRRIMKFLDFFHIAHPGISITLHDLSPESIPSMLALGELDCAFCARGRHLTHALIHIDLFEEELIVAFQAGHPFAKMGKVPIAMLAEQRYIDRLHCEFRKELLALYFEMSLELNIIYRSQREDWVQSMIQQGLGVSIMPRNSLLYDGLEYRPITQPDISRTIGFVTASGAKTFPVLDLFISLVLDYDWESGH
jgi:DNA-binding transcriptional LysR family regulator